MLKNSQSYATSKFSVFGFCWRRRNIGSKPFRIITHYRGCARCGSDDIGTLNFKETTEGKTLYLVSFKPQYKHYPMPLMRSHATSNWQRNEKFRCHRNSSQHKGYNVHNLQHTCMVRWFIRRQNWCKTAFMDHSYWALKQNIAKLCNCRPFPQSLEAKLMQNM